LGWEGMEGGGRTWRWASSSARDRFSRFRDEGESVLAVVCAHAVRARVASTTMAAARMRPTWKRAMATRLRG
jgi:hypothetical protein